jgi:PAS domain S-box-containing protein
MTSDWFESIAAIRDIKVIVILVSLFFAFLVILLGLLRDVLIITPLLFYIPIIVAAYWFPRRAVIFAIIIGAANIIIVYRYSYSGLLDLTYTTATASFYVLVAIALIISSLTSNLKLQHARYHGIFNYSDIGIILAEGKRDDLRVTEVNSRGLAILGFDSDQLTGTSLSRIMPPVSSGRLLADQIPEDGRPTVTESVLTRQDGTIVPVLISGAQMPDGMVILNIMDISDRKKTEEELQRSLREKEILLREVHHRVKNNMQVISGLIELQSAHVTDPETRRLFQESYNRIKTMGLIHEILYSSNDFARINFSTYLNELTSYLLSSYGRSPDEIPVDIQLRMNNMSMDMAVPCGLIANELISNSLKHGFPGGRHGRISIRLEDRGNECEFIVSDDGIGFPEGLDFRDTESFGLQLINGLAAHQLRGTVELRKGKGTTFVIRFPSPPLPSR